MPELSHEKSAEMALPIMLIQNAIHLLDVDYLKLVIKEIRTDHSRRDSIAVLNPNPLTHQANQNLMAAKITQLETIVALAVNYEAIGEATKALGTADGQADELKKLFTF